MPTTLITGCDYRIGFEFARQYAGDGWRVHAVCPDGSSREKLDSLGGDVHSPEDSGTVQRFDGGTIEL